MSQSLATRSDTRRINRACVECTRRKIRCDGSFPCQNCQSYSVVDRCAYRQRNRRTNPSWKTIDLLSEALDARTQILRQVLPAIDFEKCPRGIREKISQLLSSGHGNEELTSTTVDDYSTVDSVNRGDYFEDTQQDGHEWSEMNDEQNSTPPVADDVNGLAPERGSRSYTGRSSTRAALNALFAMCPPAEHCFRELGPSFKQARESGAKAEQPLHDGHSTLSSNCSQQDAIDAYFMHIHAMFPMVDEAWFRSTFTAQERTDESWTALSNMVLALGSIAAGDSTSHHFYHSRASKVIGYNTFSSGNLEMLQALILLGGIYLYYIHAPNTAYLVIGTAFRMALAMALHREPHNEASFLIHTKRNSQLGSSAVQRASWAEMRRRTWWSLVCADSFSGLYLGRPKLNIWNSGTMDVALPTTCLMSGTAGNEYHAKNEFRLKDWFGVSLRLCVELGKICTRVQDRMAKFTGITAKESLSFDEQLQAWNRSLTANFRSMDSCPKPVWHVHEFMYATFQNISIMASRSHLLRLAQDTTAHTMFTEEDWQAVSLCQSAACHYIGEVSSTPKKSLLSVSQDTFYLFQACLVPLISIALAMKLTIFGADAVDRWKHSLNQALAAFKVMAPYARPVDRYGEVVQALYNSVTASKSHGNYHTANEAPSSIFGNDLDSLPVARTVDLDEQGLMMSGLFPDWFDDDLAFENEFINWYPPDTH